MFFQSENKNKLNMKKNKKMLLHILISFKKRLSKK